MKNFLISKKGDSQNPTVVLLHGLLGASRNLWRIQERLSAQGYFTIAYDQRGHGHSSLDDGKEMTIDQMAVDLFKILDNEKIEKAHLVGHSMGGRVAMLATYLNPHRVHTLSMLDVSPKVNRLAIGTLHEIIDPLPKSFSEKKEAARFFEDHIPLSGKEKIMFQQFLMSNLRKQGEQYVWVFDLNGIRKNLLHSLAIDQLPKWKQIQTPTLLMRGENSVHFSAEELKIMVNKRPAVETFQVPNAGHWIHVDNLNGTAEGLIQFLNKRKAQ